MTPYLAITIGPIYKTILQARSTRDLWSSSYFFSVLMREILAEAEKQNIGMLLSPIPADGEVHVHGAGIYPDRAFWKAGQGQPEQMLDVFNNACKKVQDITGIKAELIKKYACFHAISIIVDDNETNAIQELNKLLDTAELYEKVSSNNVAFIQELDDNIQELYEDGHKNLKLGGGDIFIHYDCTRPDYKRLPSVIELCTRDLKFRPGNQSYFELVTEPVSQKVCSYIQTRKPRYERIKEDQELESQLMLAIEDNYEHFRLRHKYIAFVYADGDNVGKCLRSIGNDEKKIKDFSSLMAKFFGDAAEHIVAYGGIPVFIGGDDLLFALPLTNNNIETSNRTGKNLFGLLKALDTLFPDTALNNLSGLKENLTSLSYGIGISYYKYPMAEAMTAAHDALNRNKSTGHKNRLAFEVQKHSGQLFGTVISKGPGMEYFIKNILDNCDDFKDTNFLTSTIHKFRTVQVLYKDAITNDCLDNFFENHLNEKIHKEISAKTENDNYLRIVREFTQILYKEAVNADDTFETLFACLRMFQFLNQPAHE
ncbi:MAG: hypothetical protein IPN39_12700 [Chitinophagaceae bacterium]|nr:hypothetical protein [Chitinophagaceae bacterium]